ncbi:MAG: nitroreductase [Bacteroidota bacterium]
MTTDNISIVINNIRQRRTTKPDKMNGQKIADEQIQIMLESADWAPTHGMTEPWRFVVFAGDAVVAFCKQHAELYRLHTNPENFMQGNYDKLLHMGDLASQIVIAVMQRGYLPKIPAWEEMAATACAVQNLLLTASAMGIAAYWGSGGMATHQVMKEHLQIREEDKVMGILYFGYTNTETAGKRNVPLGDKVRWVFS